MGKEERKEMTAKELIKNLKRVIKSRNGRDYPIVVWNGLGAENRSPVCCTTLVESEDVESDYIAISTLRVMEDIHKWHAGLKTEKFGRPELN
jgi:hypothetical protein